MSSPQVVRKLTLFSVLPLANLFQQFDSGLISNPASKQALQSMWNTASQAYGAAASASRSFITSGDVLPLQGVQASKVQNLLARIKLYPPFDSHQVDIQSVRITKLVTPQISINMARASSRANISSNMSSDQLFDVAFNPAGNAPSINRQVLGLGPNNGAILFTSFNEDVRLYHPPFSMLLPSNPSDSQSTRLESTCFPVGGGSPFIWAYRIKLNASDIRLILCNGIHRVFSLAMVGYNTFPLAVVDALPSEIPDPFVELSHDMLVNPTMSPPLITDFLNPNVVIQLDYYQLLRTVRLNWQFEQNAIVLK